MVLLVLAILYIVVGIILTELDINQNIQYSYLMRTNLKAYTFHVLNWFPDLVEFWSEE
jgi:hypothetical protein